MYLKPQIEKIFNYKYLIGLFTVDNAVELILVTLSIVIIFINPEILSKGNLINMISQSSVRLIIALGLGGIIINKGIDFSAGSIIGLSSVISASLLQSTDYAYKMYPNIQSLPLWLPILIAVISCGIIGLINGLIVSKLKIPPFVSTIATMSIIYGITSLYFDKPPYGAHPIVGLDKCFSRLAQGYISLGIFTIPYLAIYSIVIAMIIWFIWNKTKIGKNMYDIEENSESTKTLITFYMIGGLLYGIAGSLEAARVGSVTNNIGFMYDIDAIITCILGKVSLRGGIGTVGGIIKGVLIFQVVSYSLTFIGISLYIQLIIKGIIMIAIIHLDMR